MKAFREDNIAMLAEAIAGDEFCDMSQVESKGDIDKDFIDFFRRNTHEDSLVLELGSGSGRLLNHLPITHCLEPSETMLEALKNHPKVSEMSIIVRQGVAEYIPFKEQFGTILFTNGFFQVRSDYEALIEINTHLLIDGTFLFNIYTDDSEDIICGRVLGPKNYLRVCKEFGFDVQEVRISEGLFALRKVRDFDKRMLRKIQLVPDTQVSGDKKLYQIRNFCPGRDDILL